MKRSALKRKTPLKAKPFAKSSCKSWKSGKKTLQGSGLKWKTTGRKSSQQSISSDTGTTTTSTSPAKSKPSWLKQGKLNPNGGKGYSLRSRSKKRATSEREYSKLRKEFLAENPRCCCCTLNASTVHHQRGKVGRLLCDVRWFVPLCLPCHQWVEENHRLARELYFNGLPLVSLPAEFNVYPEII